MNLTIYQSTDIERIILRVYSFITSSHKVGLSASLFLSVNFLRILSVIFHWHFRFFRNAIFPTYTGLLFFVAKSLKSSGFYKIEAKIRTNNFFIRDSEFNMRLNFLALFFLRKKPSKLSSCKNILNLELFLFNFSFCSFLLKGILKNVKRDNITQT